MKISISILQLLFFSFLVNAQNIGAGADGVYNFQTESVGAGARVNIYPNNKLSFVPQFTYYFGFNKIQEYYLGLGLEYKILPVNKFDFYVIGHGAYNSWLNYKESAMKGAKQTNWNLEFGGGVTTRKCLRPFLEYRYNLKFRETHLRLGLLYIFGCSGNGSAIFKKNGNSKLCPAYN